MAEKPTISILDISLTSGGAEKVISLLLKELVKEYQVTLVLFYNEIHFPIPEGVDVVIFSKKGPDRRFYQKIIETLGFIYKYHKLLKQRKIQYAVSFLAFPNLVNGIVSIFNKRVKTYVSERGFPSDNTSSKLSLYISKVAYPLLYNRCYKLFSNSEYINKDLKQNFGITIPMEVVYNPIELPEKTVKPESLLTIEGSLKVINVGTLNHRKNQGMIIKALQRIPKTFHLTILGRGYLDKELEQQTREAHLEKSITFGGNVKNVNDYLVASHCFVLSSHTEGFPNALLEGLAAGLPCISTNCLSGPLELLHDNAEAIINKGEFFKAQYGILVSNDDDKALAKALEYLQNHPNERVRYSKLSLERAKNYELPSIYNRFKEFIHR
ncbi:glycosyltransferase [Ascidiimonas sp. W6]|uniref:glycosyltransferase n=1 Tax=Ascidiimonas meishanensis TaxID=3128903 RepID=UPI0030ECE988